jgi:hypothetical protein
VVAEGAKSLMEVSYVRWVEQPHGLPRASMQVRDGIIRRDFEYEAWLVVLEVDGVLGHEGEYVAKDRSLTGGLPARSVVLGLRRHPVVGRVGCVPAEDPTAIHDSATTTPPTAAYPCGVSSNTAKLAP